MTMSSRHPVLSVQHVHSHLVAVLLRLFDRTRRPLQGKRDAAIAGYHQALSLKPDDVFAGEMLKKALQVGPSLTIRSSDNKRSWEMGT